MITLFRLFLLATGLLAVGERDYVQWQTAAPIAPPRIVVYGGALIERQDNATSGLLLIEAHGTCVLVTANERLAWSQTPGQCRINLPLVQGGAAP